MYRFTRQHWRKRDLIVALVVVAAVATTGAYIVHRSSAANNVLGILQENVPGSVGEALPHGMPTSFDWYSHSTLVYPAPPPPPDDTLTATSLKGQVYVDTTNAHPANTRVEIKDCQMYGLQKSTNSWQLFMDLSPGNLTGKGWTEDWTGNDGSTPPFPHTDIRSEADGGKSVLTSPGWIFHFYKSGTNNPPAFNAGNNYSEFVTGCSARLVLSNPNGPDDRGSAAYLISQSADWKAPDGSCPNSPRTGLKFCPGIGESKFIRVTNNWRRSVFSTMDATDLQNDPLPPVSLFTNPDGTIGDGGSSAPPPDTTPPTISFTAPAAAATVSGTVTISATASDNVGVTKVVTSVDNVVINTDTNAGDGWNTSWSTPSVANGAHTLKVAAYDAANNTKAVTRNVTVSNSTAPQPPVINSFTASPATVNVGSASTLNWTDSNVTTCSVTPNGATNTAATSWATPTQLSAGTKTYTLTCQNSAGVTDTATTDLTVNNPPSPPSKVVLTASATAVQTGTTVTLSWTSTGSASCTLNPGNYTASGTASSKAIAMSATTTFTVTCSNTAGSTTSSGVTVTVSATPPPPPPPVIVSFTATPTSVTSGSSSTLSWQTSNVSEGNCSLLPSPLLSATANGSWTTPPLTTSIAYTLTCVNGGAVTNKSVSITVGSTPVPPPPAPSPPPTDDGSDGTGVSDNVVDASTTANVKSTDTITLDTSSVTNRTVVDSILKVEFYEKDRLILTVTEPPFTLNLGKLPKGVLAPGVHTLTQRTYYKDGSVSNKSQVITIVATKASAAHKNNGPASPAVPVISGLLAIAAVIAVWFLVLRPHHRLARWLHSIGQPTINLNHDAPDTFFYTDKSVPPGEVVSPDYHDDQKPK